MKTPMKPFTKPRGAIAVRYKSYLKKGVNHTVVVTKGKDGERNVEYKIDGKSVR